MEPMIFWGPIYWTRGIDSNRGLIIIALILMGDWRGSDQIRPLTYNKEISGAGREINGICGNASILVI